MAVERSSFFSSAIEVPATIEQGYFIFTLMPSLQCSLNCPHCYLTLKQRRSQQCLSLEHLEMACQKIAAYYLDRNIENKTIVCYWYGGEPTEMGMVYTDEAVSRINHVFQRDKGYHVNHIFLTSLVTVNENVWFPFFSRCGNGYVQTSFDGRMRGKGYVRKWEKKVKAAIKTGLRVATISVVNNTLVDEGAESTLDYLADIGVCEASFLPFMLNSQNQGSKYEKYAPTMAGYSQYMIALSRRYLARKAQGLPTPEIGQMRFILEQSQTGVLSNIAGQTLFLLPNGDFVLPDYKNGYLEYQQPFGNILKQDFAEILSSSARRDYLRKQITRNRNRDCLECEHSDKCVMEFWKENREMDECFGAKQYVEWVMNNVSQIHSQHDNVILA